MDEKMVPKILHFYCSMRIEEKQSKLIVDQKIGTL